MSNHWAVNAFEKHGIQFTNRQKEIVRETADKSIHKIDCPYLDKGDGSCSDALRLIDWNDGEIQIIIQRGDDDKDYFIRDIRDITIYNGLMVITWKIEK